MHGQTGQINFLKKGIPEEDIAFLFPLGIQIFGHASNLDIDFDIVFLKDIRADFFKNRVRTSNFDIFLNRQLTQT